MSTWPFLSVSLPSDHPVRYFAFSFSSLSLTSLVVLVCQSSPSKHMTHRAPTWAGFPSTRNMTADGASNRRTRGAHL